MSMQVACGVLLAAGIISAAIVANEEDIGPVVHADHQVGSDKVQNGGNGQKAAKSPREQQPMFSVNCSRVLVGQYKCNMPKIDPATQEPFECTKENLAPVNCTLNDLLECAPGTHGNYSKNSFTRYVSCNWTNGYSFEATLLLSIFLGMFGADRFYLGYPGLGLLKFCTLGFLFFGQLLDIVLIAMQKVKPADGSNYIIKFFGPRITILSMDNTSFVVPRNDW